MNPNMLMQLLQMYSQRQGGNPWGGGGIQFGGGGLQRPQSPGSRNPWASGGGGYGGSWWRPIENSGPNPSDPMYQGQQRPQMGWEANWGMQPKPFSHAQPAQAPEGFQPNQPEQPKVEAMPQRQSGDMLMRGYNAYRRPPSMYRGLGAPQGMQ